MKDDEIDIAIPKEEMVGLTSDQDPSVDPLNSGFLWHKPPPSLKQEQ